MVYFDDVAMRLERVRSDSAYAPYIANIKEEYERISSSPLPELTDEEFELFNRTGSRIEYEQKYFLRRKKLTFAAILFLVYGSVEYIDAMRECVELILSERTWVIPAHAGTDPEKYNTIIDLFSAETAAALSELIYLIGNELSAELKARMLSEINRRVLIPYENGTHWWETLRSNWAAVCAGSVGMTYMYIADDRFGTVKDRLLSTMESYLSGFGDDGITTEGIDYWLYGFYFYICFADTLYRFSGGKKDIRHGKKTDEIAKYLQKVTLRGNTTVSFSDGSRTASFMNYGLYCYLKQNYEGVEMPCTDTSSRSYSMQAKLPWYVRELLWSEPELLKMPAGLRYGTEFYKDSEWYISRRKGYSFAAKSGNNMEEHNHNDIGSFIFATDKGQLLADIGALEYTKANFDLSTRYTLLQNSSLGHSVPIIDGKGQEYGREYKGSVIKHSDDEFILELGGAYSADVGIKRSFKLCNNGVDLFDSFKRAENEAIIERFISVLKPEPVDCGICIGDAILVSDLFPKITECVLRDHYGKPLSVFLIDYTPEREEFTLEIRIKHGDKYGL